MRRRNDELLGAVPCQSCGAPVLLAGYHVLSNEYARKDEPDLYLIVVFDKFVDAAEGERRRVAFEAYNQRTTAQLQAESGDRVKIRTLAGDMLLREQKFK